MGELLYLTTNQAKQMAKGTQPKPSPRIERKIVTATEWDTILRKWSRADEKSRKRLYRDERYEISIEDIRDQVVGIVHETFGRGDDAFHEVRARHGAHPTTLRNWELGIVKRPQLAKLRETLRACGKDIGVIEL